MNKFIHELKIYPKYFEEVMNGNKTFEVRKNDRHFKVGDAIVLNEWDNIKYTGRKIHAVITYILDDTFIGLEKGYVAFAFAVMRMEPN